MSLPTYELRINPEQESFVDAIALVEQPAIESDFLAFSKQEPFRFSANDEKKELMGAAMIPDMKIYRKDAKGEYNVFFSKDTVREIAQTFFQKGFQSNLNVDHTATPAKSYVFQSYIVDAAMGMTSPKGLNLPDGSWVVGVKVTDDAVWNDIKAGKRKGFSVEGLFNYFNRQEPDNDVQVLEALQAIYNQIKSK